MGDGLSDEGAKYDSLKFLYLTQKLSENSEYIKVSDLENALIKIHGITSLIETLNGLKPVYLPYILQEYIITGVLKSTNAYFKEASLLSLNLNGEIKITQEGKEYIDNKTKAINEEFKKYIDKQIESLMHESAKALIMKQIETDKRKNEASFCPIYRTKK